MTLEHRTLKLSKLNGSQEKTPWDNLITNNFISQCEPRGDGHRFKGVAPFQEVYFRFIRLEKPDSFAARVGPMDFGKDRAYVESIMAIWRRDYVVEPYPARET